MLSRNFQSEGKVQAGSESIEFIPFTQKQTSLSCDITNTFKESALSNSMQGSF